MENKFKVGDIVIIEKKIEALGGFTWTSAMDILGITYSIHYLKKENQ